MTPVNPEVLQALTAGIQSEVASYVFYVEAAKRTDTHQLRDILEKLAFEEKMHFQVLERQHDSLVRSEKWISTADVLKAEGLPDISEEMNETHRALIDKVRAAKSLKAILDIAYRLEVEAFELFDREAQRSTSDEGRKVFTDLAKFEEGHMRIITEMIRKYAAA